MVATTTILAGAGLLLLAGGAILVWAALRSYRHGQALAGAVPFTERSAPGEVVTVEGTVDEPVDGQSLEGHFTATPCLAYACEVLERKTADREDFDESTGGVISERSRVEEDAVPFGVDAGGQRIRVEAPDAHLSWSGGDFESVSRGSVVRNRLSLRALVDLVNLLTGSGHKRRRYYEARLGPGDPVSVTGTVRRNGDEVALESTRGTPLVVSTNSVGSPGGDFRRKATSRFIWAVILGGVGGALLYALAGTL